MFRTSLRSFALLAVPALALATGCNGGADEQSSIYIPCGETADCVARGGTCEDGYCRANNECATSADCEEGECLPDPDFGGLCVTAQSGPPLPGPAWSCTTGADCPVGQGCGSDAKCHADGECQSESDCQTGELCYNAGNDATDGFCASDRPAVNPYCRADGLGACRYRCYSDGTCGNGQSCVGGFCHWDDECTDDSDCTPNHICEPLFDYGFNTCTEDPDPTCVTAPDGACRFECITSPDCPVGAGGCEADGYCHASNECDTDQDCSGTNICYPHPNFGGLCGPPRP
jgi:hypothetical protein